MTEKVITKSMVNKVDEERSSNCCSDCETYPEGRDTMIQLAEKVRIE